MSQLGDARHGERCGHLSQKSQIPSQQPSLSPALLEGWQPDCYSPDRNGKNMPWGNLVSHGEASQVRDNRSPPNKGPHVEEDEINKSHYIHRAFNTFWSPHFIITNRQPGIIKHLRKQNVSGNQKKQTGKKKELSGNKDYGGKKMKLKKKLLLRENRRYGISKTRIGCYTKKLHPEN